MASVGQSEFGSQSALTHESFTTLDLAETSALDRTWHIVPFEDESTLVLVTYLSVAKEPGEDAWTVIIADSHRYITACSRSRRNRLS